MSDKEKNSSTPMSIFFRAPTLSDGSLKCTHSHNETVLEKILQKSAFQEAKKQWKSVYNELEQA